MGKNILKCQYSPVKSKKKKKKKKKKCIGDEKKKNTQKTKEILINFNFGEFGGDKYHP